MSSEVCKCGKARCQNEGYHVHYIMVGGTGSFPCHGKNGLSHEDGSALEAACKEDRCGGTKGKPKKKYIEKEGWPQYSDHRYWHECIFRDADQQRSYNGYAICIPCPGCADCKGLEDAAGGESKGIPGVTGCQCHGTDRRGGKERRVTPQPAVLASSSDRQIAEAATKGAWEANDLVGWDFEHAVVAGSTIVAGAEKDDASFIAHFNPQKVIEMLDELEQLRKENALVQSEYREIVPQALKMMNQLALAVAMLKEAMMMLHGDTTLRNRIAEALSTLEPSDG